MKAEMMASRQGVTIGNLEGYDKDYGLPKIMLVCCGESGSNTISLLSRLNLDGITAVTINANYKHLIRVPGDEKFPVDWTITSSTGCRGDHRIDESWAKRSASNLQNLFRGIDLVFVIVEMGEGMDMGLAPFVAGIAKDLGAIVVSVATTPFWIEPGRISTATDVMTSLRNHSDTCIVIDKNRLLECAPHLKQCQAFHLADQIIARMILGFIETLIKPSLINLDWADVRTIMSTGGASFMFVVEGDLKSGPENIVRSALRNPSLQSDFCGAKACLLHMTGGPDMTLKEAAAIAGAITLELDPAANVIWGARIDPDLVGKVRLMAIITGA